MTRYSIAAKVAGAGLNSNGVLVYAIQEEGRSGGCHLVRFLNGVFQGDTWHESVLLARQAAGEECDLGVLEWVDVSRVENVGTFFSGAK